MPFFNILKGHVKKSWIDKNNHMNISRYVEVIDKANDKLNVLIFKNKFKKFLVASKFLIENKKELLLDQNWSIHSSVIKIEEYYFIPMHIIYNEDVVVARSFIKVVGFKKRGKILKFTNAEKNLLNTYYTEGIKSAL